MKIATIVANDYTTNLITPQDLRKIGAVWSSLDAHNRWLSDNVVCYSNESARIAVNLGVNNNNHFFINSANFDAIGKQKNIHYFEGNFPGEFTRPDEIIAMHLAGMYFDLVILLGFDLSHSDDGDQARYISSAMAAIQTRENTQWVAVLPNNKVSERLVALDNFTTDTIDSILTLTQSQ